MKPSLPQTLPSSLEKLKAILGITEDISNDEIAAIVLSKYTDELDQKLMMSLLLILIPNQSFLSKATTQDDLFMLHQLITSFSAKEDELDENIKQIAIFALLVSFQKLSREMCQSVNFPVFEDRKIIIEAYSIISQLTNVLERNIDQIKNIKGEDQEISGIISNFMLTEFCQSLVFNFQKASETKITDLIICTNRLDPNQEKNTQLLINKIIRNSNIFHAKLGASYNLSFLIKIFEELREYYLLFDPEKNGVESKIYIEPRALFNNIIDECKFYQEKLPLNFENIVEIFNYSQKNNGNLELQKALDQEITQYLNKSEQRLSELKVLIDTIAQDDNLLEFILTKQNASAQETLMIAASIQDPINPNLIAKIKQHQENKKPDKSSTPEAVKYDAVKTLRELIGIDPSEKLKIDQIYAKINKLNYKNDKATKLIRDTLKDLSKILLNDKKAQENDYRILAKKPSAIQDLYRETKDTEIRKICDSITIVAMYCFMDFVLDKSTIKFPPPDLVDLIESLMQFIEINKHISLLIEDDDQALLRKINNLYKDYAPQLALNPDSGLKRRLMNMVVFLNNTYPHPDSSMTFLINEIAYIKLENYSDNKLEELIEIFKQIKDTGTAEDNNENSTTLTVTEDCKQILAKAIEDCRFYQRQELPIDNIFRAITIFKYQNSADCGNVVNFFKEKFANQIAEYFKEKVNNGFADELGTFLKIAEEENNFLQFLVNAFDENSAKKLEKLLSKKPNLQKQVKALCAEKVKKIKQQQQPEERTIEDILKDFENPKPKQKKPAKPKATKPEKPLPIVESAIPDTQEVQAILEPPAINQQLPDEITSETSTEELQELVESENDGKTKLPIT